VAPLIARDVFIAPLGLLWRHNCSTGSAPSFYHVKIVK